MWLCILETDDYLHLLLDRKSSCRLAPWSIGRFTLLLLWDSILSSSNSSSLSWSCLVLRFLVGAWILLSIIIYLLDVPCSRNDFGCLREGLICHWLGITFFSFTYSSPSCCSNLKSFLWSIYCSWRRWNMRSIEWCLLWFQYNVNNLTSSLRES